MGLARFDGKRYTSAIDTLQAWVSPVAEPQQMAHEQLEVMDDLPGLEQDDALFDLV